MNDISIAYLIEKVKTKLYGEDVSNAFNSIGYHIFLDLGKKIPKKDGKQKVNGLFGLVIASGG